MAKFIGFGFPETTAGTWIHAVKAFALSSVLGYTAIPWSMGLFEDGLAFIRDIVVFFPGTFFAVALLLVLGRLKTKALEFLLLVVSSAAWYGAFMFSGMYYGELGFWLAGAVSGLIGGVAVAGALAFLHPGMRGLRKVLAAGVVATLLGAVSLPAGSLFGEELNLYYWLLTYLIWQVGFGCFLLMLAKMPMEMSRQQE